MPVILLCQMILGLLTATAQDGVEQQLEDSQSRSVQFYKEGNVDEAIKTAEQALELAKAKLGLNSPSTATCFDNLAFLSQARGNFSKSEELYQKSLEIRISLFGPDDLVVATSWNNLALLHLELSAYDTAESCMARSIEIRQSKAADNHSLIANSLNYLGVIYSRMGNERKAEKAFSEALNICEKALGLEHLETAQSLNNLAASYDAQGMLEKAEKMYRKALSIREKLLGINDDATLTTLSNLARLLTRLDNYEEAEKLSTQVLRSREEANGFAHPETAYALKGVARVYELQGRFAESEKLLLRALQVLEGKFGPNHHAVGVILNELGLTYDSLGRYEDAENSLNRALKISESTRGIGNPGTAQILSNLATIQRTLAKLEESEVNFMRALEIYENTYGNEHISAAETIQNLALLRISQGQYAEAEKLSRRALHIRLERLGSSHSETMTSFNNLSTCLVRQGKLDEAEHILKQVIEISVKTLGNDHPKTATCFNNLGSIHQRKGEFESAEGEFRKALAIWEKTSGNMHRDTGAALNNLGQLKMMQGKLDESEIFYERALAISKGTFGLAHPESFQIMNNLAYLHFENRNFEKGNVLVGESLDEQYDYMVRALSYFPEAECIALQSKLKTRNLTGIGLDGEMAAIEQIRFKGAVGEAIGQRKRLEAALRSTDDGREILKQRNVLSREYQTSFLQEGEEGENSVRLKEKLSDLEKKIAASIREGGSNPLESMVAVEDVRGALGEDSSLMELFFYSHQINEAGKNTKTENRYSSALIRAKKPTVYIAHGKSSVIDRAVMAYRKAVSRTDDSLTESERKSVFRDAESTIYQTILAPLEEHLEAGSEVIFSLDSQLHFVPLHMVRNEIGIPFGSKYKVRIVTSGRDITKTSTPQNEHKTAFVLGNPTYRDNAPLMAMAEAEESGGNAGSERGGVARNTSSINLTPLPGTAREIDLLGEKLESKGYRVEELSRESATEEALVAGVSNADIVHVATHGFFFQRGLQGIGAMIQLDEDQVPTVTMLIEGGPANLQGELQVNDRILGIAQSHGEIAGVVGNTLYETINLIRGPIGTTVTLEIRRGSSADEMETKTIQITRGEVEMAGSNRTTASLMQDPMYRSGLALCGAQSTFNLWKEGKIPPPSKDGVLLAAEASLLDLRGTDLVVLSACETAAGETLDGEGVMGLRRAFISAGANNTIMTLWPVHDESTVEIMNAFYDKYLNGIHPSIALAEVQNELYAPFVEKYGEVEAIARLAPFICTSIGKVEK